MDADAPGAAQLGQHRRGLRPSKLLSDTHPGSGAEGQIGAARLAWGLGVETVDLPWHAPQPAVWPEPVGLGPPPRVAMQQSRADQAHRPHLHSPATEHHRLEDPTAEDPGRRPQP